MTQRPDNQAEAPFEYSTVLTHDQVIEALYDPNGYDVETDSHSYRADLPTWLQYELIRLNQEFSEHHTDYLRLTWSTEPMTVQAVAAEEAHAADELPDADITADEGDRRAYTVHTHDRITPPLSKAIADNDVSMQAVPRCLECAPYKCCHS